MSAPSIEVVWGLVDAIELKFWRVEGLIPPPELVPFMERIHSIQDQVVRLNAEMAEAGLPIGLSLVPTCQARP